MIMLRKEVNNYEEYKVFMEMEAHRLGLYRLFREKNVSAISFDDYCVGVMEKIVFSKLPNSMKSDLYSYAMNFSTGHPNVVIREDRLNCLHWYDFDNLCKYLSKKGYSGYVEVTRNKKPVKLAYIYAGGTIRVIKDY